MMKRLIAVLAALSLMVSCACALGETAETAPATEALETAEPAEEAAEGTEGAEAEGIAEEAPAEEEAPVVLATVNGREILSNNEDLTAAYTYYMTQAAQYGDDTTSEDTLQLVRGTAMSYAIQMSVIRQKAEEEGVMPTDEQMAQLEEDGHTNWNTVVDNFASQYFGMTENMGEAEKATTRESAASLLEAQYGYTEELFVHEYVDSESLDLIIAGLQEKVLDLPEVTDEEVKAHFDALVEEDKLTFADVATYEFATNYYGMSPYYKPEGYRGILHILLPVDEELLNNWQDLTARYEEQQSEGQEEATDGEATAEPDPDATPAPTEEPVTEEMIAEAEKAILDSVQPQVDEIMARLENGESFLDLVDEYGTDTGMKDETNRENGYAVHAESMMYDTNFQRAAMELEKVGDVSKPVVTQFGVHILHYLKDIPGGPIEFTDELKETLKQEMTEENLTTAFNDKVNGWIEEAEIVYTEDGEAWRLPEEETEDAEAAPAEGETAPAEGETAPAEGETETTPDEGEAAPAEGETAETPAP